MFKNKTNSTLIILFILALIVRIYLISITDNGFGADPDEKIRITAKWMHNKENRPLFPGDIWLPLHYYLIALSLLIYKNIPLSPRLLHALMGALTTIPFYKMINIIFNRRVALWSSLILIIYPLHILCSIVTLSEGPFVFFSIVSLYLFFKYCETERNHYLFLSCISVIFASMIRYEAWLFILLISLFLFINRKRAEGIIFLFVASLFPLYWTSAIFKQMVHRATRDYIYVESYYKDTIFYWLKILNEHLSFLFLSLRRIIKDRKTLHLAIIFLSLLIFLTYGLMTHKLTKNAEFTLILGTLFIPFAVYGFENIYNKTGKKKIVLFAMLISMFIYMSNKSLLLAKYSRYYAYIKDVAGFIKHNAAKNDNILLNNYNFQSNHIPVAVGTDLHRFAISNRGGDKLITQQDLVLYIKSKKPKYVVYSDEAEMKTLFEEDYLVRGNIIKSWSLELESWPYKIYKFYYSDI